MTQAMHNPPGNKSDQPNLVGKEDINSGGEETRDPPNTQFLLASYSMTTPSIVITRSEEDPLAIEPNMEMQLMPAHIKHESELTSLFSHFRTRADADQFMASIVDPARPPNLQFGRDMILSTRDDLVIGHTIDDQGLDRTDLFLLNMGLVTPTQPGIDNQGRMSDLDVQYGAALVQFYPCPIPVAPPGWEIPHLTPSSGKSNVSDTSTYSKAWFINKNQGSEFAGDPNASRRPPPQNFVLFSGSSPPCSSTLHDEVDSPRTAGADSSVGAFANVPFPQPDLGRPPALVFVQPSELAPSPSSTPPPLIEDDEDSEIDSDDDDDELAEEWEELKQEISDNMRKMERRMEEDRNFEELRGELYDRLVEITDPLHLRIFNSKSDSDSHSDYSDDSQGSNLRRERARLDELLRSKVREAEALNVLRESENRVRTQRVLRDTTNFLSPPFVEESYPSPPPTPFHPLPVQIFHAQIPPLNTTLLNRPPTPFPSDLKPPGLPTPTRKEELERMEVDKPSSLLTPCPPLNPILLCAERIAPETLEESLPRDIPGESAGGHDAPNGVKAESTLPSPGGHVSVEDFLMPRQRTEPPPPVYLRGNRYREIKDELTRERELEEGGEEEEEGEERRILWRVAFEPHIVAMTRDRVFHPFIEVNRPGPKTNATIPILDRPYYPYADLDVHYNIARVEKLMVVDLRSMKVADPGDVPKAQMGIFSVLAPRNAPRSLVFPGRIWPDHFGPIDFPHITASTIGERLNQLRMIRSKVVKFVDRIRRMFTDWQLKELDSSTIDLYVCQGEQLIAVRVDRSMFFRIIHPTFNHLVTRDEASFLRGACYALRDFRHEQIALSVDRLLRTPHYDETLGRDLLENGCLGPEERVEKAKSILEDYECMAEGDWYA
jgi:hypothetical protein